MPKSPKRLIVAAPFTLSLLMLAAPSAFAQTANDEVIVTATKIPKSVQHLGLSVSVVEGETLSRLNGAEELSQKVPGLQAAVANGSQVAFQIRGIGAVDHQALTPTAAAVYVDGVYQATNVQTSPLLFDIDRAEILKGPQGSLYGRNASSGAINFNSVLPGQEQTGYLSTEFGNFERINLNAAATLPVSDIFSLRVSGRYLSQDAALDNVVSNPNVSAPEAGGGKKDEFGLRAIGRLTPSDQTEVLLNVHYAEDNGINVAPLNSDLDLNDHEISVGPDGIQDTDNAFYGAFAKVSHSFGTLDFVSHTAYTGYSQNYGFDFDGTPAPFGSPTLNSNLRYDRDFTQVSQEFRLSHVGERAEWMVGTYLEAEDFDQEYLIYCGPLNTDALIGTCSYVGAPGRVGPTPASDGTVLSLRSLITQSRKTAALFTYNSFDLSDRLEAVFGGRLTFENIKGRGEGRHYFDDGTFGFNNLEGRGLAIGENEIEDTRLSGNLGLNYHLSEDTLFYAAFANGYKSGGFNGEVINNATHFADEGLFGAETVNAFELGTKLTRETFTFNLASFYQFYDNPQARIFVPFELDNGGSFTSNSLSNLDKATSYGVEVEGSWTPFNGLDLNGGVTWLKTKIEQYANPNICENTNIQNAESAECENQLKFDGNPLPFASEFAATLSVSYQWPISESMSGRISGSGKYQSEFFLDAEGLEGRKQDGYETIDASAALLLKNGIEVGVWGRNLSNADYAVSGYGFIGYNTFRGQPRTYGVALKYSY